jgi:hypothetical protein
MPGGARKRRGRLSRAAARARSRPWAVLVLANTMPLAAGVWILWGWRTGRLSFVPGSEAVVPSLVLLAAALGALVVLAWIAAPLVLAAALSTRRFVASQARRMSSGGTASIVTRAPLLLAGAAVYALLWLNAALLALLVAADLAAIVVALVAFVSEVLRLS